MEKLDEKWIGDQDKLDLQMALVMDVLRMGAYSLPRLVLEDEKFELHLQDVLEKDLAKCCRDIRKGKNIYQKQLFKNPRNDFYATC